MKPKTGPFRSRKSGAPTGLPDPAKGAFPAWPRKRGGKAFTLLQLIVCIVIVLVLSALSFPVFRAQAKAALTLRCTNNLRSVGVALLAYAADRDGMLPPRNLGNGRDSGKPPANMRPWPSRLINLGYIGDVEAFYCPAFAPKNSRNARDDIRNGKGLDTYGMRMWAPQGSYSKLIEEEKKMAAIEKPSEFFLVADSYWTAFESQGYGINPGSQSQAVHLRHAGKANLLFADGHVEAKGADYFETLHDKDNQGIYSGGTPAKDGKPILTTTEGL